MNVVAYYRVSTAKQGESGLGLDAQRAAVMGYAKTTDKIAAEFTEVESGKRDARPVLAQAIAKAKEVGGVLVIAKLDRLSRNAGFIFSLRDSGVQFIAVDMPEANTLTIGIMAVMAQHERELISKRTKEGLQARQARVMSAIAQELGVSINDQAVKAEYRRRCQEDAKGKGLTDNTLPIARDLAIASKVAAAAACEAWTRAESYVKDLRNLDKTLSLRAIADKLNASAFTTREGRPFHATTVKRLLAR
jgi:DNA invertase Pin-like site-specific DNA recombinase